MLPPVTETICMSEEPGIMGFDVKDAELEQARLGRPTLKDTVAEVRWPR